MARLRVETDVDGCRILWLDRPEKRNALDEAFLSEILIEADRTLADPAVRVVVLRSTSPIFCAGADLNDWANTAPVEAQRLSALGSRAFQALADLPIPVVAAREGAALGGGLELALACDIRIASTACRLGFPEPRLGNSPAWGGMARLVEAAGKAKARDLLLTGDIILADEAHAFGLVQRLFSPEEFQKGLSQLIQSIVACDPGTLTYIKAILSCSPQAVAAQEAAIAGFVSTRPESRKRKQDFLSDRKR
jgi:enoyl-CoA hydratase/carnithine racemase